MSTLKMCVIVLIASLVLNCLVIYAYERQKVYCTELEERSVKLEQFNQQILGKSKQLMRFLREISEPPTSIPKEKEVQPAKNLIVAL